jgi:Uma2 family endonuclease
MTRVALTYREYAALPDDGRRYEIHDGELSATAAPGMSHQEVSRRLLVLVLRHVEARDLGKIWYAPVDVILADETTRGC